MSELLKGASTIAHIKEQMQEQVARCAAGGVIPCLAIVRVGERPDDLAYERNAVKKCEQLGIACRVVSLPVDSTTQACCQAVARLDSDKNVHGILLFRPLPKGVDEASVIAQIRPEKDVDCMTQASLAKLFCGDETGFAPCTAEAVVRLLEHERIPIAGKRVVVLGRSLVVGKPLAMMLLKRNATVTIGHTATVDLPSVSRQADILVAAVGQAKMVNDAAMVAPEAVVVDVGIHVDEQGRLCGDVDAEQMSHAAFVTPVPGGVGGITTWLLLEHVVRAAVNQKKE